MRRCRARRFRFTRRRARILRSKERAYECQISTILQATDAFLLTGAFVGLDDLVLVRVGLGNFG